MATKKDALISALTAICRLDLADGNVDAVELSWRMLTEWVAVTDKSVQLLLAKKESLEGRYALAIKALDSLVENQEGKDADGAQEKKEALDLRQTILKENLGYGCWAIIEEEKMRRAFPLTKLTL
jgi:hypothetical protein